MVFVANAGDAKVVLARSTPDDKVGAIQSDSTNGPV